MNRRTLRNGNVGVLIIDKLLTRLNSDSMCPGMLIGYRPLTLMTYVAYFQGLSMREHQLGWVSHLIARYPCSILLGTPTIL
jgi:hypothetical protein